MVCHDVFGAKGWENRGPYNSSHGDFVHSI
jgi:hypothetical protein